MNVSTHICIAPVYLLVICFNTKQNQISCTYTVTVIIEYTLVMKNRTSKAQQGVHLISHWKNEITHLIVKIQ